VYKVKKIRKPLENYRDIDAFKIYVSDSGLLAARKDLAADDVLYMVKELNDFKGGPRVGLRLILSSSARAG